MVWRVEKGDVLGWTTSEMEWEDLLQTNLPRDTFTRFAHYFQLKLDETSFSCNDNEIKVLGRKYKPRHEKKCSESSFSITVL